MCEKKIFAVNSFQGNRLMIKMTFNSNFKIIRSRCRLLSPLSLLSHSTGTWLIFYLKTFFCPYPAISLISRNLWLCFHISPGYRIPIIQHNHIQSMQLLLPPFPCVQTLLCGTLLKAFLLFIWISPSSPKKTTKKLINQDFARSYYLSVLTSHILL